MLEQSHAKSDAAASAKCLATFVAAKTGLRVNYNMQTHNDPHEKPNLQQHDRTATAVIRICEHSSIKL